jgi:Domain of unknown function (DUF4190)
MTTPSEPDDDKPAEGVDLGKHDEPAEEPFDPYRFGKPDYPIPAEYAPPGYTGPVTPPAAPTPPPNAYTQPPGTQGTNPFSNPPGTPYVGPPQHMPPPYPPPGYGYGYGPGGPPPGPYQGYRPIERSSGKATAALVLGILSIVFCWLSFLDAVFIVLGLVFGLLALGETKVSGVSGRGMAIAGLVCTIVGALIATVLTVLIINAAQDCGGLGNSDQPGWQHCVRQNLG